MLEWRSQTKDDIEALLITNHIHNVVAIPMWNSVNLVHFWCLFSCVNEYVRKLTAIFSHGFGLLRAPRALPFNQCKIICLIWSLNLSFLGWSFWIVSFVNNRLWVLNVYNISYIIHAIAKNISKQDILRCDSISKLRGYPERDGGEDEEEGLV